MACLLFLTLVIFSVSVSAYRPLVVVKNEATSPSSSTKMEGNDEKSYHVDTRKVNSVGHNDELVGEVYPDPGPGSGSEGGFQFHLGPIGLGAIWDWGYPFPVYGPPFLVPPSAWPYGQPGSYMTPYQGQGQGQRPGYGPYGLSSSWPYGYGSVPSSKGLNSPGIHN